MDEASRLQRAEMDRLYGAITAQKFAIENLWAQLLHERGASATDARATGAEMLRQFEDLPPKFKGGDVTRVPAIIQHGVDHLERIWASVEARLAG